MQEKNTINELLQLTDKELELWLQAHEHDTHLDEATTGFIALWLAENKNTSALRTATDFDMKEVVPKNNLYIFRIAAGVALLLIVGISTLYFFKTNATSNFEAYYIEEPSLPVFLDNNSVKWSKAMQAYELKNYNTALSELNAITTESDTAMYYKAICFQKMDDDAQSLELLEKISSVQRYYTEALYLQAYIYAKRGEKNKALNYLNKIPKGHNLYAPALSFINAINQNKN